MQNTSLNGHASFHAMSCPVKSLNFPTFLQLIQPAFQKVLSYLRTKALEKFKTDLNLSLESGKGFAASVRESTESSLSEFDQGCAGIFYYIPVMVELIPGLL
jgi:hypothetical protein